MLGGLKKLLGRVEAQVNPFDGGRTFANTAPQQARQLPAQIQYQQQVPAGQDPTNFGYPPDITVDPTGRLPYTAPTQFMAQRGNQYTADPTNPKWNGVDPAQFGYPADPGVQSTPSFDPQDTFRHILGLFRR